MGVATSLSMLNFSAADQSAEESYGEDVIGMVMSCTVKAQELIYALTYIASRLPQGDQNIAPIQTIIANLT